MKYKSFLVGTICLLAVFTAGFTHPATMPNSYCIQDNTKFADSISVNGLQSLLKTKSKVRVIDVRLKKDYDKDTQMIPTAYWQDPGQVKEWVKSLPKDMPIVVYCVHGHRVSRQVVNYLVQLGYPAQRLVGGIEAWREQKNTTVPPK